MHFGSKFIYYIIIVLIVLSLLIWKGLSMRRDLPFQEVVPLNKGIAVINAGNWYNDDLKIHLLQDGKKVESRQYDEKGFCLFDNLSNDKYTVEISRKDIKGKLLYKTSRSKVSPVSKGSKYIILVGASIGKSWNFPELGNRMRISNDVILGNRTIYDFDKSSAINSLIQLPVPVTAVIIKECSSFFPRELESSISDIKKWVSEVRSRNITPVLATVVPVTKDHDESHPGRFKSILEFNDFIRKYGAKENIQVLDLEKSLRIDDDDRHLNPEYAQPDGSHLVKKTYEEALDPSGTKLINRIVKL